MRYLIVLFPLIILVGCHTEPEIIVLPTQLIGTWTAKAIPASEKSFTRWTFEPNYVYTLEDTLNICKPVNNSHFYRYSIENDKLTMIYEGITNGLFPIPVINRRIISITTTEMVMDSPRQVFNKCP